MAVKPDAAFWRGKRVLVTGHTGFKGSWLAFWLNRMGAHVVGLALRPNTTPALFDLLQLEASLDHHIVDIRQSEAVADRVRASAPEIVFHLAAQPLVRASYAAPLETFATNVLGTAAVLDALRNTEVRAAVMVTTDKVYRNAEHGLPYHEDDDLGGHDPYSASKAASEIVIASYRDSFLASQNIAVASARAGNVIGGGDWAVDRLIPDTVRAWTDGTPLHIRCPDAVRPWQHVLEPLGGYLVLAQRLCSDAAASSAFNFGPDVNDTQTVRSVTEMARHHFPGLDVTYGNVAPDLHEAGLLSLDIEKARAVLQWQPCWALEETIDRTLLWYRHHKDGVDVRTLCNADIDAYESLL